jgi:hypothetical protein
MVAVYFLLAGVMALNFYALTLVLLRAPLFRARLFRPMVVNIGLSVAPGVVLALVVFILDPAADLLPAPADWLVCLDEDFLCNAESSSISVTPRV